MHVDTHVHNHTCMHTLCTLRTRPCALQATALYNRQVASLIRALARWPPGRRLRPDLRAAGLRGSGGYMVRQRHCRLGPPLGCRRFVWRGVTGVRSGGVDTEGRRFSHAH